MPIIVGVKQLYKNLKGISQRVARGESFIVVKHSKPVFRVVPYKPEKPKRHTLKDLQKLQFSKLKGVQTNLSERIDEIVYSTLAKCQSSVIKFYLSKKNEIY